MSLCVSPCLSASIAGGHTLDPSKAGETVGRTCSSKPSRPKPRRPPKSVLVLRLLLMLWTSPSLETRYAAADSFTAEQPSIDKYALHTTSESVQAPGRARRRGRRKCRRPTCSTFKPSTTKLFGPKASFPRNMRSVPERRHVHASNQQPQSCLGIIRRGASYVLYAICYISHGNRFA